MRQGVQKRGEEVVENLAVASLLKRWLLGIHQGAVRQRQLDYYLDEYAFRFNRRTSKSRGLLFHRLMQQAVQIDPVPYRDILAISDSNRTTARE